MVNTPPPPAGAVVINFNQFCSNHNATRVRRGHVNYYYCIRWYDAQDPTHRGYDPDVTVLYYVGRLTFTRPYNTHNIPNIFTIHLYGETSVLQSIMLHIVIHRQQKKNCILENFV